MNHAHINPALTYGHHFVFTLWYGYWSVCNTSVYSGYSFILKASLCPTCYIVWNHEISCLSYFSNTAEMIISTQPHHVLKMSILSISFSSIAIAPMAVLGAIEQQQIISELDENEKAIFGLKRWDWTIDEKQVLSYGIVQIFHETQRNANTGHSNSRF